MAERFPRWKQVLPALVCAALAGVISGQEADGRGSGNRFSAPPVSRSSARLLPATGVVGGSLQPIPESDRGPVASLSMGNQQQTRLAPLPPVEFLSSGEPQPQQGMQFPGKPIGTLFQDPALVPDLPSQQEPGKAVGDRVPVDGPKAVTDPAADRAGTEPLRGTNRDQDPDRDPDNGADTGSDQKPAQAKDKAEDQGKDKDKDKDGNKESEKDKEADEEKSDEKKKAGESPPKDKQWYEKYRIRGYAQFRLNEVLDDDGPASPQVVGDSSVGDGQSFLIRRARLILQGDVTDRISIYFQPDFAVTPNGAVDAIQFVQVRDWYSDIHLDDAKEFRIRAGQSKIPYGWENMQSSQNRLPLDRNDALNSAARNERDLGAFFYWTPEPAQELFKSVVEEGLKGSGNYGIFGMGFYNGQGGSFAERNDNLHFITRLTVPKTFANGQIVEVGAQAYTGLYSVYSSPISPLGIGPAIRPAGTIETGNQRGLVDKRVALSFIHYPQPFGLQAEWNVGRGPGLDDAQRAVIDRALYGGYVMAMYRHVSCNHGEFIPFIRYNLYRGGYKTERNAPTVDIEEWELGLEWQFSKNLELVTMYTLTDRTNTRAIGTADTLSYGQFNGDFIRWQLQVNY